MSSASFSTRNALQGNRALERTGEILDRIRLAPEVENRRLRKAEVIESVRMRRQSARQNLGFSSRPFVLCGLPVKCPPTGTLVHERRNGQFVLLVTGHPNYGLRGVRTAWFCLFGNFNNLATFGSGCFGL